MALVKDAATIEPWPGSLLPPFDLLLMHVIDQIQPPGSQRGVESESGGRNEKESSTQLQFVFKKLRVFNKISWGGAAPWLVY